jgi:hypothetical protein
VSIKKATPPSSVLSRLLDRQRIFVDGAGVAARHSGFGFDPVLSSASCKHCSVIRGTNDQSAYFRCRRMMRIEMLVVGKRVATVHSCRVWGTKGGKRFSSCPHLSETNNWPALAFYLPPTPTGSAARISNSGFRTCSEELK